MMNPVYNYKKCYPNAYEFRTYNKHPAASLEKNKIAAEKLEIIKKAIFLYTSRTGITTCKICFINNIDIRKKLYPFLHRNPKVLEACELILFFTLSIPSANHATNISYSINNAGKLVSLPASAAAQKDKTVPVDFGQNVQNTYQAANAGLNAAALENIEAYLLEDLHYNEIDEVLELKKKGFRSVAFLALMKPAIS